MRGAPELFQKQHQYGAGHRETTALARKNHFRLPQDYSALTEMLRFMHRRLDSVRQNFIKRSSCRVLFPTLMDSATSAKLPYMVGVSHNRRQGPRWVPRMSLVGRLPAFIYDRTLSFALAKGLIGGLTPRLMISMYYSFSGVSGGDRVCRLPDTKHHMTSGDGCDGRGRP